MKIGIISDSHGNVSVTADAVAVFRKAGVSAVFHCGDIGSYDVLTELAALQVPIHAVMGNVDIYSSDWKYFPTNVGIQLHDRFGGVELDGFRFALLHGDDQRAVHHAVKSGDYDFVLTGHSHEVHDYMQGTTRCLNPGTAGRGSPNTCAVLDMETGECRVVPV